MMKTGMQQNRGNTITTVNDVIDYIGVGRFTIFIVCAVGLFFMAEASELNLIAIISPELRCIWNLTPIETSILSSMTFLGLFFGNVYWGFLSDIYGRKMMLIAGSFTSLYFGFYTSTAQGYKMFLVIRFFVGFGLGASVHIVNFIGELVPTKHRGKSVLIVELFYALGSLYIGVAAMLVLQQAGWRIYILITVIPPGIFFIISFWLPNSLHYLQVTNDYDELLKTINRISVINNTKLPKLNLEFYSAPSDARGNIRILLGKEHRMTFLLMMILTIGALGNYFTLVLLNTEILSEGGFCHQETTLKLNQSCHRLTTNDYKRSILVVLAEIPGIILPTILIDRIGRKIYLIAAFIILGVGYLCLNFCLSKVTGLIFMFILRAIVAGASQVPFVMIVELFPTVVRGTALGILTGVARLYLVIVPFLVQSLYQVSLEATTGLFATLSFLSAMATLFIPETKEKQLASC